MPNDRDPCLIWKGKEDVPETQPCKLVENPLKSYGEPDSGNLLIHGDNLPVLKALQAQYTQTVKCAYIDPPYNTGATFAHYDDSVSHGDWLSMMKPRLELIRTLLQPDGVIAVQIGFDEMAYLKVLMDELYGRSHCIGQIAVRMSHCAGMKRKAVERRFIKNTEYILLYYNEKPPRLEPLCEVCEEYPVNYYQFITAFPQENGGKGAYRNLIDVLYEKFKPEFAVRSLKKANASIKTLYAECPHVRKYILQNKCRVVRKDSNVPNVAGLLLSHLCENEFIGCTIQNAQYYIGLNAAGRPYQLYAIAAKVKSCAGGEALTNLVGDWWDGFYKDMSRVDIEGGVKMKTSKKPERLIEWILTAVTSEGDLVLDAFLGSGTTAAVAMKMRRRFIGIEAGEQCLSLCLPRLQHVVDGTDRQGVSRSQTWQGGSGFTFATCGEQFAK